MPGPIILAAAAAMLAFFAGLLAAVFFWLVRPWLRGVNQGVGLSVFSILEMRLRGMPPALLIDAIAALERDGADSSIADVQKAYAANKTRVNKSEDLVDLVKKLLSDPIAAAEWRAEKPSTEVESPGQLEVRIETDHRVPLWFFSWLLAFMLCVGGVLLTVFASADPEQFFSDHWWLLPVTIGAGFLCVAVAASPWLFGVRCRECRTKLRPMKLASDARGYKKLRFYCEACQVIWETHLVSGPGDDVHRTRHASRPH